ncbi:MAG TPA: hypothetical protein DGG95_15715 [Cytophagales bacterium]|jgi:hypothetical protein|nr:hypothetical protein [Cytophagales bacterium]
MKKIFIFFLLAALGCGRSLPQFENMDMAKWRDDKNGCKGDRLKMINPLIEQKDKLKALSETEILKVLGRPDQNELWKRNQKFYHYFLEPSLKCDSSKTHAKQLTIRFNAMDLAKEIEVE